MNQKDNVLQLKELKVSNNFLLGSLTAVLTALIQSGIHRQQVTINKTKMTAYQSIKGNFDRLNLRMLLPAATYCIDQSVLIRLIRPFCAKTR